MKKEFINQEVLEDIIAEKERGYINTIINLFLYPRFIQLCEEELAKTETEERTDALSTLLERHKTALKAETESKDTWELLLPYLDSLRN